MRLWSRGLGKNNVGINFGEVTVKTLEEAIETMPTEASELLLKEISSGRLITMAGKIIPTGWQFVIVFEQSDIFALTRKLLSRRLWGLLFGSDRILEKVKRKISY